MTTSSSNDCRKIPMSTVRRTVTLVSALPETLGDGALLYSAKNLFPLLPTAAQLLTELFMVTTEYYHAHPRLSMSPVVTAQLLEMQRGARCETCDHMPLLGRAMQIIAQSPASAGLAVWECLQRCQQCLMRRG